MTDLPSAKNYLLRILARRDYSTTEIRRKLTQRGVSDSITEQLIEEFKKRGYLDDQRYSEALVRQNAQRKKGPRYLQQTFFSKGLSTDNICLSVEMEADIIRDLLRTRYQKNNLNNPLEKRKVAQALLRRGFSINIIFSTIRELFP